MDKTRRRRLRSAELASQWSEELRNGTPAERHAAAVHLGKKSIRKGGRRVHRLGGLARVRASRIKGGQSRSPAKIAACLRNAAKARATRLAKSQAQRVWEKQVPMDY